MQRPCSRTRTASWLPVPVQEASALPAFAPFLARFAYGNTRKITVFNDAGPVAINLDEMAAIDARASRLGCSGKFYPASCTDCDDHGQGTAIIKWRLDNDSTIREAFYSTDGDATNRFFLNVPTQETVPQTSS